MVRKSKPVGSQQDRPETQYAAIAARRANIIGRLENLPAEARNHAGYKSLKALLGPRYVNTALKKRMAVLISAEWLLDVLEAMTMTV